MTMKETVASLTGVSKEYRNGDETVIALHPTTLAVYKNELTLILGPSGSGKTTLLSLLGCVIYPTAGEVRITGECVSALSENRLAAIRLKKIGFVFQGFNLIQPLNALENVMMPLRLLGMKVSEAQAKAAAALSMVKLEDKAHSLPKAMSGGQQQRVSIARALVTDPMMILCDEPTASLDSKSITTVMEELRKLAQAGKAVVIVTHDERLRKYADRIIHVINGYATEQDRQPSKIQES